MGYTIDDFKEYLLLVIGLTIIFAVLLILTIAVVYVGKVMYTFLEIRTERLFDEWEEAEETKFQKKLMEEEAQRESDSIEHFKTVFPNGLADFSKEVDE